MTTASTGQVPSTAAFRVGDWLLEPSLDRLSRNGKTVHLRPQLTNLLVLLAQNAGRTVSKDEILSKVWDGQFVAESGMTRCIAEIRQALGDDAREPKIVETITKRGYRLVAPVVMVRVGAPMRVVEAEAAPSAPVEPPEPRQPERPTEPTSAAPSPRTDADVGERARSQLWLRQAAHLTLGLLALAGILLALVPIAGGWIRTPALGDRDTVLLADVINTTGDSAFDHTLRLALTVHLEQAPFIRILPPMQVRAGLERMGRSHQQPVTGPIALELCRREGAAVLLAGSVARIGSHYVVGLEATACSSGESIDRQLIEVERKEEVLAALGTAAGKLRRTLGESRASLRRYDVPIVQATTASLDALKALSLGDFARDHARTVEALTYYRRATELDPQFALAWARRGAAAHNLVRAAGDERFGDFTEVRLAFRNAYELRERVSEPERFYILAHYYRSVAMEPDKAIETYDLWSRTYPGSAMPATNRGSIYVNLLGQFDKGQNDAREAVRLTPGSTTANLTLIAALLGSNRLDEARQVFREATTRGIDNLEWRRLAFEIAVLDGDKPAMQEQVRWASGNATAEMAMAECRALAAASAGRLRESRQLWAEAERAANVVGTAPARAGVLLAQAEAEVLLGNPRVGTAEAEAALAIDPRPVTTRFAAAVLALAGSEPSRAARLLEGVRDAEPDTPTDYVWSPVAQGLVAALSGRYEEALQSMVRTRRYERGRYFALVPLGVRAWIEARVGRNAEAANAFRDLLALRPIAPLSPWLPVARLRLAASLAEAGEVDSSRKAYDDLIAQMKDADRDAPILVAAVRERAALR